MIAAVKSQPRPQTSEARQGLAEAIAEAARLRVVEDGLAQALRRASDMVTAATAAVDEAAGLVARIRDENTEAMISAASSGKPYAEDGRMQAARADLQAANDRLESAQLARDAVQARQPAKNFMGETDAAKAASAIRAHVKKVLAEDVPFERLLADVIADQDRLRRKRHVLGFLAAMAGLEPLKHMHADDSLNYRIRIALARPDIGGFDVGADSDEKRSARTAALADWQRALEALTQDATTPFPIE